MLDRYYADFLRRTPDAAGREAGLASWQGGTPAGAIAEAFIASEEYFIRSGGAA